MSGSTVLAKSTSGLGLLSPESFAIVSYAIFIVCMLIPPGYYFDVLHEHNFIFLDVPSFTFVTACVLAFLLGCRIFRRKVPVVVRVRPAASPLLICGVVLLALALNTLSVYLLAKNNPELLTYVFAGDADAEQIRNYLDYTAALAESLPFLIATLFWANYRRKEYEILTGKRALLMNMLVMVAAIMAIMTCVIKLARYDLMPLIFGLWLSGILARLRYGHANRRTLLTQAAILLGVILTIFIVFSWIRGYQENGALARSLFGYGPASYNRLALVLDGRIKIPTMHTGINAFPFLNHIPFFYRFIDLQAVLGVPSVDVVRASEFIAVARGGLDPAFNWVSTFGYFYYDFEWLSPAVFVIFGGGAARVWSSLKAGKPLAIVIYPFVTFSVLFWFGTNYFFRSSMFTWIVVGLLVVLVERIFSRSKWWGL